MENPDAVHLLLEADLNFSTIRAQMAKSPYANRSSSLQQKALSHGQQSIRCSTESFSVLRLAARQLSAVGWLSLQSQPLCQPVRHRAQLRCDTWLWSGSRLRCSSWLPSGSQLPLRNAAPGDVGDCSQHDESPTSTDGQLCRPRRLLPASSRRQRGSRSRDAFHHRSLDARWCGTGTAQYLVAAQFRWSAASLSASFAPILDRTAIEHQQQRFGQQSNGGRCGLACQPKRAAGKRHSSRRLLPVSRDEQPQSCWDRSQLIFLPT